MTRRSIVTSLFGLAALTVAIGCSRNKSETATRHVTMGIQTSPAMGLVMVAKDAGFFQQQGLDVEFKEFTAGKFALQAFLGGSLDFCIPGDVPAALATLQGSRLKVVATVVRETVNEVRVVALRDAGVDADARTYFTSKKRKLATSFGGGPEFFTYKFLEQNGIGPDKVEIISQRPEDMPAALESKSVDAISVFDPFAWMAERRLGDKGTTFSAPSLYSELYVLAVSDKQLGANAGNVDAVLRALVQAADFIRRDPVQAKTIVRKYTGLDDSVVNGIWSNFVFEPALPARLLTYWNDEARWAVATGKVPPTTSTPDFQAVIDDSFLRRIRPEAVEAR